METAMFPYADTDVANDWLIAPFWLPALATKPVPVLMAMVKRSPSRASISGSPSPLTSTKEVLCLVVVLVPLTPKEISALPRIPMEVPKPAPQVLFSDDSSAGTPLFDSPVNPYPRPYRTLSPSSMSGSPSPFKSVQSLFVWESPEVKLPLALTETLEIRFPWEAFPPLASPPPGFWSSFGLGQMLMARAFFAEPCLERLPLAPMVDELALNFGRPASNRRRSSPNAPVALVYWAPIFPLSLFSQSG